MSFHEQVAVITGAASGIGEACAKALAAEAATVVVSDVDVPNGERVAAEIREAGGNSSFHAADISSAEQVEELFAHAVSEHGGLHLAVNNAGIAHAPAPLHEVPLEVWDRLLAINLRGTMLCMRAELAHYAEHGGGAIVNVASGTGLKAAAGLAAYVATKHGVVGLTRQGALDYATQGIRVNAVAPGTVRTPAMRAFPQEQQDVWSAVIPQGRMADPEEIADAVVFLLSAKAGFITGAVLEVDGGYMQSSPH
jgi:NAD(P)-dependent dehydrogenase (short-subunit alcohol dehydrogenase family)